MLNALSRVEISICLLLGNDPGKRENALSRVEMSISLQLGIVPGKTDRQTDRECALSC